MKSFRNRRALVLIALLAICAALLLLLIPQGYANHTAPWLAFLPVFFVGLLTPFYAPRRLAQLNQPRVPFAPQKLTSFQRPPPFRLA